MTGAPTPQSLEEQARHCPQCCEGNEASDPLTMIEYRLFRLEQHQTRLEQDYHAAIPALQEAVHKLTGNIVEETPNAKTE